MASSSARTELSSRRVKALLLSPVVILFASATRLLIISNYDTTTATTLAASSGVVGTLLGTIVPLLPLFLPAILIFFMIFRRWGLVLLTALFTALVSPASIHSVGDGLKIAANTASSTKGIWHGALQIWPGLQDGLIHIAHTVWGWGEWILGIIWSVLAPPLRVLGLDERELRLASEEGVHHLLQTSKEWGHYLQLIWSSWPPGVKIAGICSLAALLWVLYAPPWSWFPKELIFSGLREKITSLLWVPNTAIRFLGIATYGLLIAAVCGFSVLYLQRVYDVPLKSDIIFEILRRPWLPTEKITLSSGKTLVGYTMSISIGWHVFLDEQTRTIQYLRTTDVTNRAVCHLNKETKPNTPFFSPGHIDPGKVDNCF